MSESSSIQPGRYRHYKGNEYTVLGTARHSETDEVLVLYRQEYGDRSLWVRPLPMFRETVEVDGKNVRRFQPLEPGFQGHEEGVRNFFADLPQQLPEELAQILIRFADVRIERIISHGQASPDGFWYDQTQHEWVIVLKGAATLQFEEGRIELKPGDFINIPAHQKHRVDWTTPAEMTVWLAVFYG